MHNFYHILKEATITINKQQNVNVIFNKNSDTNLTFVIGAGPGSGKNILINLLQSKHPDYKIINLRDVYYDYLVQNKIIDQNIEEIPVIDTMTLKKGLEYLYNYLLKLSKERQKYLIIGNNLLMLGRIYMRDQWMRFLSQQRVIIIKKNVFRMVNDNILASQNQKLNKVLQDFIRDMISYGADYEVFEISTQSLKKVSL